MLRIRRLLRLLRRPRDWSTFPATQPPFAFEVKILIRVVGSLFKLISSHRLRAPVVVDLSITCRCPCLHQERQEKKTRISVGDIPIQ